MILVWFLFAVTQADISHAYQILRNNGVPQENIITMMFDDVANSPS